MSAIIPTNPSIGIHDCRFILTNNLCSDKHGDLTFSYHKYTGGKTYYPLCYKLMNNTDFSEHFHLDKEFQISNYNIRYMNSLFLLRLKELVNIHHHLSVMGPDIWNGSVISIENSIEINSDLRSGVGYLKRTRKQQIAQIPRILNMLLNKYKTYVVANTDYRR